VGVESFEFLGQRNSLPPAIIGSEGVAPPSLGKWASSVSTPPQSPRTIPGRPQGSAVVSFLFPLTDPSVCSLFGLGNQLFFAVTAAVFFLIS